MKKYLLIMLSVAVLTGCSKEDTPTEEPAAQEAPIETQEAIETTDEDTTKSAEMPNEIEIPNTEETIAKSPREKALESFIGKPSVIILAGTFCPHCRTAMPEYKTKIWDNYKDSVNIFINVIDNKKFDVAEIPQKFRADLTFDLLTGESCGYVPSWILLDAQGAVAAKSCGGEKELPDMIAGIETLLQ